MAWGLLALFLLSGCAMMGGRGAPALEFESLTREEVGNSPAGFPVIRWTASASGGSGELSYEFRSSNGSVEIIEQEGAAETWEWIGRKAGRFRVKATIRDGAGSRVESGWSSEFVARSPIGSGSLIAVLPVENLSNGRAPLELIGQLVRSKLSERGYRLVDDEVLEEFMEKYRLRDTGGLQSSAAQAIKDEIGAEAYLVTSLESYEDRDPPIVSLISRLVLSGEQSEIMWMDGAGLSGDGHPGFLELGVIEDIDILLDQTVHCLVDSLARSLWETVEGSRAASPNPNYGCDARARVVSWSAKGGGRRRHRPRSLFRGRNIAADRRHTVALLPFLNLSDRNNAGRIVALHFVNQLLRSNNFSVVEPGLLKEQLLKYRIIMESGPSLANAEVISSKGSLGVDLVFSGTVFDYQDAVGIPKVDFSAKVIEARSRKLVWSSRSYNTGQEGVFFFSAGRVATAHHLTSQMARGTFEALARADPSPSAPRKDPRDAEQQ